MTTIKVKKDLSNLKFGRLTAIKPVDRTKRGITLWLCTCECGSDKVVRGNHLSSGRTRSCGCWHKEVAARQGESLKKHGHNGKLGRSKTYNSWRAMIERCTNPKHIQFKDWGGRGIKVCKEWELFENFLKDMGERPDQLTLDRIDVESDYSRCNCRWATWSEQASNKRVKCNELD